MKWGEKLIYLDGSRFFFDIEGCFSKLVSAARAETAAPGGEEAEKLCRGFAKYYGTAPENVRAGKDYPTLLRGILPEGCKAVIPDFDDCRKFFIESFPGNEPLIFKKPADMKLRPAALAAFAAENSADVIFLSSPCCPTSLEMTLAEIGTLVKGTGAMVIVDESRLVEDENSAIKLISGSANLTVLKKLRFGGEPVLAAGTNLPHFVSGVAAPDEAAAAVIFEHDSALKTARRKLEDSRDSLYIRIKKLAVRYDSVERLYRSKADCVFLKVKDAEEKAKLLAESGIAVRNDGDYLCIFAGDKPENEAVLKALEKIL